MTDASTAMPGVACSDQDARVGALVVGSGSSDLGCDDVEGHVRDELEDDDDRALWAKFGGVPPCSQQACAVIAQATFKPLVGKETRDGLLRLAKNAVAKIKGEVPAKFELLLGGKLRPQQCSAASATGLASDPCVKRERP